MIEGLKDKARQEVDRLAGEILGLSRELFENPELSGAEHRSVSRLREVLEGRGFQVQVGLAGLPTAFLASAPGRRDGPRLAFLAEYDALPGIGHGCGHNFIGAAGVYAGIVAADLARTAGGSVSVVGTPAEETVGGKVLLARSGLFDEFDAAMIVHPSSEDRTDTTSLACNGMEVTFLGVASHAVAHPEKGVNALQPLLRLFAEVEAARQSWGPDVKAPGVILEGGVRANIVPERAVAQFSVRGATIERVRRVWREMESMVERLAGEVGARFEIQPTDEPYFEMVTNPPLADAYRANLAVLGRQVVDGPRANQGSLDMGNVSHVCPSVHPLVRICPPEMASHTREFGAASVSPAGERALLDSVKAMSMSAADLLSRPQLVLAVRQAFDEFHQARGRQSGETP